MKSTLPSGKALHAIAGIVEHVAQLLLTSASGLFGALAIGDVFAGPRAERQVL